MPSPNALLHKEDAGIGHVVDVEKFAHRTPGTPDDKFGIAAQLGFMRLADQRRQDVAVGEVVVVVGAVEIGGHHTDVAGAVLAVHALAQLDAGDLGDGVGLVGRLQRPGQQVFLPDRLRAVARIDAAGAEESRGP